MKRFLTLALIGFSTLFFNQCKKVALGAALIVIDIPVHGQITATGNCASASDTTFVLWQQGLGYTACSSPHALEMDNDFLLMRIKTSGFRIDAMNSGLNDGDPTGFLWTGTDGTFKRSPKSSLTLPFAQLSGTPTTLSGYGITDAATATNSMSFTNKGGNISMWTNDVGFLTSINSSQVTTALGFTPVTDVRTLTINGVTQNLTANRTWTLTTTDVAEGTNLYFTNARSRSAISLTTTGTSGAATYNSGTGVLNIPQYTVPSAPTINNNVSRSISNAAGSTNQYTISASQYAVVNYAVNISYSVLGLVNFSGTLFLEYSTNGGSSWVIANQCARSGTVTVNASGSDDLNVSAVIPPNALVRLRPATTNCTISYTLGQEALYTY